jgi:hypothetical protein
MLELFNPCHKNILTLAIRIFTIHNQAMYGIAKRLITNGHKPSFLANSIPWFMVIYN